MSAPAKINFKMYQGSTFSEVLRWEGSEKVYKPISAITKSAPLVVTATAHGVPVEWRVKFTNIAGMTDLNSSEVYHQVTDVTANSLTINAINSLGFKEYISGGIVEYNKPIDLTGFTARMQIRAKLEDTAIIETLTTENSKLVIDNVKKNITILLPATTTEAYKFSTAVYSLELISSGGYVTPLASGTITLVKEVTR